MYFMLLVANCIHVITPWCGHKNELFERNIDTFMDC